MNEPKKRIMRCRLLVYQHVSDSIGQTIMQEQSLLSTLSLSKFLGKIYNHRRRLLGFTRPRAMPSIYVLHDPLHATALHEQVLQESWERLVLRTSQERNLAFKRRLRPRWRWSRGFKRKGGMWKKRGGEIVRSVRVDVVVKGFDCWRDHA